MKKFLSMGLICALCLALTGCCCLVSEVNINSDASGIINVKMGYTEEAYAMMNSLEGAQVNGDELKPFVHNGRTYYGANKSVTFSSIEEFNRSFSDVGEEYMETSGFSLVQNQDKSFTLTLRATSETSSSVTEAETSANSLQMSEEETEKLLDGMVVLYTFNFPSDVVQVSGDNKGITINNNKLEIDLLKLDVPKDTNVEKEYVFTTQKNDVQQNTIKFNDISEEHWAYKVVLLMSERGIISGYSDGSFKPENHVTREEFSAILAKTLGLQAGDGIVKFEDVASDRWSKGYIDAVSPYLTGYMKNGNYYFEPSSPAIREDMAVAVVKAKGLDNKTPNYSVLDKFTDKGLISENAKKYIAIAVEEGIMSGNINGTFNPTGRLTRAEFTALMYNVLTK